MSELMPRNLSLDGEWSLTHFLEGTQYAASPTELAALKLPVIPAVVPGNVELDLVRAGELPEPFYGMNTTLLRPFEFHEWWYRREFVSPDYPAAELVFEGLDCFATVWLNGQLLGTSANAMIAHRFDVTVALAAAGKTNELVVRLGSPINAVRDCPIGPSDRAQGSNLDSIWARKPSHAYGWDIMPRVVSAGIWRSVRLEERRSTDWTNLFLRTFRCNEQRAELELDYAFRTSEPILDGFAIQIDGVCGESTFSHTIRTHFTAGHSRFGVAKPRLWWPRGYGEAALYEVTVTLLHQGQAVAVRTLKTGVRTVELDRSEVNTREKPGHFFFKVNGERIFCKGSNWVPADAFHSRDAERIPDLLAMFADMECNMLRCWGGNVYEPHLFFDICDREGILVWQDFAMACASYPQTPDFQEMLREGGGGVGGLRVAQPSQHRPLGRGQRVRLRLPRLVGQAGRSRQQRPYPQGVARGRIPARSQPSLSAQFPVHLARGVRLGWRRQSGARTASVGSPRLLQERLLRQEHRLLRLGDGLPRLPERRLAGEVHHARQALARAEQRGVAAPQH